ncbi:type II toxin-antitoxin system PemK/MazF family toxin [Paenibacillus alginolyticus]|uniref:type II toxin-antitoxin system PemK/MazF family toxin n=1 Tax=Paenibacillus alginolyticus TaxID=59839 RepID=UPI0004274BAD|nr:type II toxin-antitoxin system PemK/MazF family toxin [Paenibacillus alginolyticus]MCY9667939.1 type II toxin-antitoxin system PemK/MazF family toxin [Paenibacillus alginolyticus]
MKLKDSSAAQSQVLALLKQILPYLENEDEKDATAYANELVEMTKLRNLAITGWRPDTPIKKGTGKFPIMYQHVYNVVFSPVIGSEQALTRPAIIIRSSGGNTVIVIPLTDEQYGNSLHFNVDLKKPFDEKKPKSTALLEQIRVIDKRRIESPYRIKGQIAKIDDDDMRNIESELAVLLQMDLDKIKKFREEAAKATTDQ